MNSPTPPGQSLDLSGFLPFDPSKLGDHQKALPAIAKDAKRIAAIEDAISRIPTFHTLYNADARHMEFLKPASVHLVVTSPPYWTLKEYQRMDGQLGFVSDYETFLKALDEVWRGCYDALVPGGRLVCVVGDVCLSRAKDAGSRDIREGNSLLQAKRNNGQEGWRLRRFFKLCSGSHKNKRSAPTPAQGGSYADNLRCYFFSYW